MVPGVRWEQAQGRPHMGQQWNLLGHIAHPADPQIPALEPCLAEALNLQPEISPRWPPDILFMSASQASRIIRYLFDSKNKSYKVGIIIPSLQMRKLRPRLAPYCSAKGTMRSLGLEPKHMLSPLQKECLLTREDS